MLPSRSVVVVGLGLVGERRARTAAEHPRTHLAGVCDLDAARARAIADRHHVSSFTTWRDALAAASPDIVVVSTPHRELAPIAVAALESGCDVLVEKPFGRTLDEARRMAAAAQRHRRSLAIGFNHRFIPTIAHAIERARRGDLGDLHFVRCIYGHGGRPGYESEWRADRERAGGGELLDQGVHALDLLCWLFGKPTRAFAELATLAWPIAVEDNAMAVLRWRDGPVASIHASWSQWQNRFSFHIYGSRGALEVEGLGGSYGPPSAVLLTRQPDGPPVRRAIDVPAGDDTWTTEWRAFVTALDAGEPTPNRAQQGLVVMQVLDALYRSAAEHRAIELG